MRHVWAVPAAVTFFLALTTSAPALEVKQRVEIKDKKIAEVWAKVGGWCAIQEWHPAIAKCEESKDGDKIHRTLTTKDGGVIKETMTKSTATSYTYTIDESPLPVQNYSATFSAVPDDDDEDEINIVWQAKFEAKGAKAEEAAKVIKDIFKSGLDAIKKNMKG